MARYRFNCPITRIVAVITPAPPPPLPQIRAGLFISSSCPSQPEPTVRLLLWGFIFSPPSLFLSLYSRRIKPRAAEITETSLMFPPWRAGARYLAEFTWITLTSKRISWKASDQAVSYMAVTCQEHTPPPTHQPFSYTHFLNTHVCKKNTRFTYWHTFHTYIGIRPTRYADPAPSKACIPLRLLQPSASTTVTTTTTNYYSDYNHPCSSMIRVQTENTSPVTPRWGTWKRAVM